MVTLAIRYSTTFLQLQQLLGFQVCDSMIAFDWLGRNAKEIVLAFLDTVSVLRGGTVQKRPELQS
jgi:hypothetical protein